MATYVVANIGDGGLGSLRQAIMDANSNAGPDQINFAIPGAGPHTIQPLTALPTITDPVNIDGTTQPGSIRNSLANGNDAVLKIELDGSLAGSAHGLWITAGNSSVRGLVINRFAGDGIRLETLGGNVIEGNFIGVDPTGLIARGNGTSGIGQPPASFFEFESAFGIEIIGGSSDNIIGTNGDNNGDVGERNVISSNLKADVFISGLGTNRNVVAGNFIGTNAAGTASFGQVALGGFNYNVGVFINGGSQSNRIGTDGNGIGDTAERNIISGHYGNTGRADDHHHSRGVEIANLSSPATTLGLNVVAGNYIGTDVTGTRKLGNSIGVGMQLGDRNRIGTNSDGVADAAERNLLSGNSVGVHLFGSNQNTVSGNYVGTDLTGTTNTGTVAGDLGNSTGIWVLSSASNTVGGTAPGAGNLVSGNIYYGINIQGNGYSVNSGGDSNVVQGNLIGTDVTGTVAMSNGGYGIYLNSNDNLVGGATASARNIISASGNVVGGDGIEVVGYRNVIQGNYIGTDITGTQPLGNSGSPYYLQGNGIRVFGGTGNQIGGTGAGQGNLIAFNVGAGVMVSGFDPARSSINGNSIHSNGGLGIDLAPWAAGVAGVTGNDLGDLDVGPNEYQNFPLLASVESTGSGTEIMGTLNSTPSTTFTLDFYANTAVDPSGYGEGRTYLGYATVATDINGDVTFNVTVAGIAPIGQFVSATATNSSGSTSEFSGDTVVVDGCVEVPSLIVTTTSDVVALDCETSLREAINYANSHSNSLNPGGVRDVITFNIPGAGPHTISPVTRLPIITDPVIIDGYTQAGASVNTLPNGDDAVLQIELDGTNAGNAHGLYITAGNSTVRGLAINRFASAGVRLESAGGNHIEGNFIGTDATGTSPRGNTFHGISLYLSNDNVIGTNGDGIGDAAERNVVAASIVGINVEFSHRNVVAGNYVGTDHSGTVALPNSQGIAVLDGIANTIGGTNAASRNLASGNLYYGIHLQGNGAQYTGNSGADNNVVQGNFVGTDALGTSTLPNGGFGMLINSNDNTVGGATAAARNLVSGNGTGVGGDGIQVIGHRNFVQGNFVGTDVTGTQSLGNKGSAYFLQGNGISVQGTGNVIGGTSAGQGNLVANNVGAGVLVAYASVAQSGASTANNSVRGNSIFNNGRLGIDVAQIVPGGGGVTINDLGDPDVGPNDFQNFPLIASVSSSGSGTNITGTLNSTPLTTFTLDFYANAVADVSGHGEGQTYLGEATVTTDINGDVTFNVNVSGIAPVGQFVSATATNSGSTSEFSGLTTVIAGNVAPNNLVLNTGSIFENDLFALTGTFIDLDLLNNHTVTINWGDGGSSEVFTLPVGARAFSFNHRYLDDNPTITSSDVYRIDVTLSDGALNTAASTNVTVKNIAPSNLAWSLTDYDINENGTSTINVTFDDPGTRDSHQVTVDWGDGAIETYTVAFTARSFSHTHTYRDDNPSVTPQDNYTVSVSLTDDDSGVGTMLVYGLKSENGGTIARSKPPTHLYSFNSDGTGFMDHGVVKLGGIAIDVDALAYTPQRGLLGFQLHHASTSSPVTGSSMLSINPVTAAATTIGNTMIGRDVRAAAFESTGRLWVLDAAQNELLEIDPTIGQILGSPTALTLGGNPHDLGDSTDLSIRNDGTFFIVDSTVVRPGNPAHSAFYTLNAATGALTLVGEDTVPQAPTNSFTASSGLAFTGASSNTLFTYEANGVEDIYQYDIGAGFTRTLVFGDIISVANGGFNAGRGDLAAAPGTSVTVHNLDPVIDVLNAASDYGTGVVHLSGYYHDVGNLDTHTLTITWGDGVPETINVSGGSFSATHTYVMPGSDPLGTFGISATLKDDDSGSDTKLAAFLGATISGTKFRDINKDGIRQGTENVLNGWIIYLDTNNDGDRDVGESFTGTSGLGQYSFTNLPAGTYHVREEQLSGWTQTTPLLDVTIGSGQTFASADMGNYREATVSGIKFDDFNGDGVHTIGEIGLANWTIYLDANNNGSLDSGEARTQTDANGGYLFDPVPAGTYNVREVQQSGWMQTTANPFVITVAPNVSDQTYSADIGNFQLGSIQGGGVKFHDVNRNGIKDIGEVGLSGWTIYLDNNNNNSLDSGEPTSVTDGAGGYSFGNLPAGVYHIREVQQSGWVQTTAPLDRTISTSGQTVAAGAIGNYRLATISGTKYEDGNHNGQRDPGELGLGNWTIYLDANGNNAFDPGEINTQTTLGGLYSFGGLDIGTFVVREVQQVGWTQTTVNPGPFNVLPNVSAQTYLADFGNFHGFLSGSISGRVYVDADNDGVLDTGEARLFGITVNLIGVDDQGPVNRSMSTDVLGAYHFDNLRPGNYRVIETQPFGYVDGKESLGNLGGTSANDSFFLELGADEHARDYNFGELIEAKLSGYVFDDFDDDGQLDFGEGAVSNVVITLDGVNDLGQLVHLIASTDTQGYFEFDELRPGTYSLTEQQRSGFLDGKETLGSQGGTLGNDQFTSINLTSGDHGMNYNFGDHADTGLHRGQTATIGYWQNKNGQALISSLNGGPSSTSLGNWLASQFPNMYGVDAADRNLTGKTNAQVAAFYVTLFKAKGPKIDAQVMATALAVYVTNTNLAGSYATAYGFQVSSAGTGAATFGVGTSGAAFGVANGSRMTILQILSATNARAVRGKLYNGATSLQNLAIVVFDGINQGGDIL